MKKTLLLSLFLITYYFASSQIDQKYAIVGPQATPLYAEKDSSSLVLTFLMPNDSLVLIGKSNLPFVKVGVKDRIGYVYFKKLIRNQELYESVDFNLPPVVIYLPRSLPDFPSKDPISLPVINEPTLDVSNYNYPIQRVYFGTNRINSNDKKISPDYNGDISQDIKYGFCDVSIPAPYHKKGNIENPVSFLGYQLWESEKYHFVFKKKHELSLQEFKENLSQFKTEKKQALIFIHGYNVSFNEAAKRTAQLTYDTEFKGTSLFFSWPSAASADPREYLKDRIKIKNSINVIQNFIEEIVNQNNFEEVFIIAHSMGTFGLTNALSDLLNQGRQFPRIKEIILAAPDINKDTFEFEILPSLSSQGHNITLYTSSYDLALNLSEEFWGDSRLGDSENIFLNKSIETIDASHLKSGLLGHSYFADKRAAIDDIAKILEAKTRASGRTWLETINLITGTYWKFKKK